MIVNQSILPFYSNRAYQHNNYRWYAQGLHGPVVAPAGFLPTFQIIRTANLGASLTFTLRNVKTGTETDITADVNASGLAVDQTYDYDVILYSATLAISVSALATYELIVTDGSNTWYSEHWAMSDRTSEMIKVTYWHLEDFDFDQGTDGTAYRIRYAAPFKNILYIDSDLFKPTYPYYREVEQRLGRNFDKLHISAKEYRFDTQGSEEILDALRLIPLHDKKEIEYKGRTWVWQDHGDLATIRFTFRTNTISLVGGRSTGGAYELAGGSCVATVHSCVGLTVQGSAEYNAYQYTDANGDTQDLQVSDRVLVETTGGSLQVFQYFPSSYAPLSTAAGEVVYVQSNGLYYTGVGSNRVILPQIAFYDIGNTNTVTGTALPGATHYIYEVTGGVETLLGTYVITELAEEIEVSPGAELLRMRLASGACGIFQDSPDYEIQAAPGGDAGIGFDIIGTTLKVY